MQQFLDIEKFLKTAQEEDLFVIVRPGPFICAEFEFGGLPSWLLREKCIKVRTSDEKFMKHVRRYFNVLLTLLAAFQFTKGGPIVSFQVENEYASMQDLDGNPPFRPDSKYLTELRQLMFNNNISELLFTSDSAYSYGSNGSLPTLFQTANFGSGPEDQFKALIKAQGNKPLMATEFWAGWFDHWSEKHQTTNLVSFMDIYKRILSYPASVNLYMFHGGTSWGFLNGANKNSLLQSSLSPDTTSYDYNAPLTEYGDYTPKYFIIQYLLRKYNPIQTRLPAVPIMTDIGVYLNNQINEYLPYEDFILQLPYNIKTKNLVSMENLPINNDAGQSFGYIIYRKKNITITKNSLLKIKGYVYDHVNVYINNKLVSKNTMNLTDFGYWKKENSSLQLSMIETVTNATLDLVVENIGRCNFGEIQQFSQFKGLWQDVLLDNKKLSDWEILPMEFKQLWIKNLKNWRKFENKTKYETGLYKAKLVLNKLEDTFINMQKWKKGIVIVNNFVLGRYWHIGPQQTLYLPAPMMKIGVNEIVIFEEFAPQGDIMFSKEPILNKDIIKPK